MSVKLCACGEPYATCPHLGVFANIEAKSAYFRRLDDVNGELDALVVRTDAKLAIAVAQTALSASDDASIMRWLNWYGGI